MCKSSGYELVEQETGDELKLGGGGGRGLR